MTEKVDVNLLVRGYFDDDVFFFLNICIYTSMTKLRKE